MTDYTDLIARLRRLYVSDGTNYVQEAAQVIEALVAERDDWHKVADLRSAEIIRLTAELTTAQAAVHWRDLELDRLREELAAHHRSIR